LAKETEIAIYRIIQAALHNVAAHANARKVEVRFIFQPMLLHVVIEDDGIGFDPKMVLSAPGEHLGLIGMKERAEGINGSLTLESVLNEGTCVKLELPVPEYIDE
jgi:signal transduction histidine kinase